MKLDPLHDFLESLDEESVQTGDQSLPELLRAIGGEGVGIASRLVRSPEDAARSCDDYRMAYLHMYNVGSIKLSPTLLPEFASELASLVRDRHRHGKQRTMLLPSGVTLSYLEWGSPTSTPLMLLHDVTDSAHTWDGVAAKLSDRSSTARPPPPVHHRPSSTTRPPPPRRR